MSPVCDPARASLRSQVPAGQAFSGDDRAYTRLPLSASTFNCFTSGPQTAPPARATSRLTAAICSSFSASAHPNRSWTVRRPSSNSRDTRTRCSIGCRLFCFADYREVLTQPGHGLLVLGLPTETPQVDSKMSHVRALPLMIHRFRDLRACVLCCRDLLRSALRV